MRLASMLGWIRDKRTKATPDVAPLPPERMQVAMRWIEGARVPIADWRRIAEGDCADWDSATRQRFWTAAAECWLEALANALPPGYTVRRGGEFLLLSTLPVEKARVLLRFCQDALCHIRSSLGALASNDSYGPFVVIVFADEDAYYDYVSHYAAEGGEYAMSSGMFIDVGYGHFVLCEAELDNAEPVVVHELTHALLAHLPIPLWLNEGLAVNTEHALFPRLADPRAALYSPTEMRARHATFWDPDTIQQFWSGHAFQQAGDGVSLSYDLARTITALAARDEPSFRDFVAGAAWNDAGVAAAAKLGYPIERLVEAVLGPGDWTPVPSQWNDSRHAPLPAGQE